MKDLAHLLGLHAVEQIGQWIPWLRVIIISQVNPHDDDDEAQSDMFCVMLMGLHS